MGFALENKDIVFPRQTQFLAYRFMVILPFYLDNYNFF